MIEYEILKTDPSGSWTIKIKNNGLLFKLFSVGCDNDRFFYDVRLLNDIDNFDHSEFNREIKEIVKDIYTKEFL